MKRQQLHEQLPGVDFGENLLAACVEVELNEQAVTSNSKKSKARSVVQMVVYRW